MATTRRISAALREKALEDGYALLATTRHEDRDERRSIRDRALARDQTSFAE
jgi:hypothetical protein